eukprot:s456_g2.t1
MADKDALPEEFRVWIDQGMPSKPGRRRAKSGPGLGPPLSSTQRRDVQSSIRDSMVQTLGPALEDAAIAELGSAVKSGKKQQWKKDTAMRFFSTLPDKKQDAVSALAEAHRTDTLTKVAQEMLGVEAPRAEAQPEPASSSTVASGSKKRKALEEMTSEHGSRLVSSLAQDVIARCPEHSSASRLLDKLQGKVDAHFAVKPIYGRGAASALGTSLQNLRVSLAQSRDPGARHWLHQLDKELRATGLTRVQLGQLGVQVGERAWSRAVHDEAAPGRKRGRPAINQDAAVVQKVVELSMQTTEQQRSAGTKDAGSMLKCTYIEIPQAPKTFAVLLSQIDWMWGAEMGANECGVVIGNEAVWTNEVDGPTALLGMDLLRLGLERGESALAALKVITSLLEQHGQGGACAENDRSFTYHNSFLLADPREAWVLETAGHCWVAERIAAGARNISNGLTIGSNFDLMSEGLLEYAKEKGFWDGRGPFHWAHAFSSGGLDLSPYGRQACGARLMEQHGKGGTLDSQAMMDILRDHPGGICMHGGFETTSAMVSELREGKATHWLTGRPHPCESEFLEQNFP